VAGGKFVGPQQGCSELQRISSLRGDALEEAGAQLSWSMKPLFKNARIDRSLVRLYLTYVTTTVSTKGQIVLPAEIRKEDHIKPGEEFSIERVDQGQYLLKRKTRRRNQGLISLLLSCPVKGWFKPMDRTETTDDIQPAKIG